MQSRMLQCWRSSLKLQSGDYGGVRTRSLASHLPSCMRQNNSAVAGARNFLQGLGVGSMAGTAAVAIGTPDSFRMWPSWPTASPSSTASEVHPSRAEGNNSCSSSNQGSGGGGGGSGAGRPTSSRSSCSSPEEQASRDEAEALEIISDETVEAAPLISHETNHAGKMMFCGAVAGALSKTATAPLARLTILYQVQALNCASTGPFITMQQPPGMLQALRHIVQHEGIRSLWKGNLATIIHRVPYSAANFTVFEWTKQHLQTQMSNDVARRLVAGAAAGLVACSVAYPLDLLRTRLAVQTGSEYYKGIGHAFARIAQEEGALGLYKGLSATLLQVVPGLALNFCFYDTLKHNITPAGEPPTAATSLGCAAVAGFGTSTLTFPLDVVRRRMQVHGRGTAAGGSYVDTWRSVYRQGGLRAFYMGIVPEYCKVLPGMAIAFATYEALKQGLGLDS